MESPPLSLSPTSRRGSYGSLEDLDAYFANYVPLSNLPTPPAASISDEVPNKRRRISVVCDKERQSREVTAAAVHLTNLIPSDACTFRPSPWIIQEFLTRSAPLTAATALAACILDSLSWDFARSWREAFCSDVPSAATQGHLHVYASGVLAREHKAPRTSQRPPDPEVIALAALSLADGFLSDAEIGAAYWSHDVSEQRFSCAQINTTIRCILADIDYGLHSYTPDMVEEALEDIRCVERFYLDVAHTKPEYTAETCQCTDAGDDVDERALPVPKTKGQAVSQDGLVTPAPSPPEELWSTGVPSWEHDGGTFSYGYSDGAMAFLGSVVASRGVGEAVR